MFYLHCKMSVFLGAESICYPSQFPCLSLSPTEGALMERISTLVCVNPQSIAWTSVCLYIEYLIIPLIQLLQSLTAIIHTK